MKYLSVFMINIKLLLPYLTLINFRQVIWGGLCKTFVDSYHQNLQNRLSLLYFFKFFNKSLRLHSQDLKDHVKFFSTLKIHKTIPLIFRLLDRSVSVCVRVCAS